MKVTTLLPGTSDNVFKKRKRLRSLTKIQFVKKDCNMKNQTLTKFVKDECANYDKHYQQCVWDKPCKVLAGKQCSYFERAVLGPPNYKFQLPGYDYKRLFTQYAEQTNTETQVVEQRRCGCGEPLKPRHRYCEKCTEKRRKQAYREYNRKRAG